MVSSPRFRIAALALLGALAVATLVALIAREGADAAPSPGANQTRYLLRLTDLPPGFVVLPIGSIGVEGGQPAGPDMPCDELDPAEPAAKLAAFIRKYHPAGCFAAYVRMYRTPVPGPKPFLAGSGVLDVRSVAGAKEAFALAPQILSHFFFEGEATQTLPSPEPIGEESMLVRWPDIPLFHDGESGSYLVWRWGGVVGVVLATGNSVSGTERDALALARLQQAHIEHPTPYTEAERDDTEVALDNPKLARPVYWLGREFAPGKGLPRLQLGFSAAAAGRTPAHQRAELSYEEEPGPGDDAGVALTVLTREEWKRHRNDRYGAASIPFRQCASKRTVELPHGRATVYRTYASASPRCPQRRSAFLAQAFIGKSVIAAASFKGCATCTAQPPNPYNTFKGMAAVVRGLEARPKRLF